MIFNLLKNTSSNEDGFLTMRRFFIGSRRANFVKKLCCFLWFEVSKRTVGEGRLFEVNSNHTLFIIIMEDDEMKQHREKWKMWNEQRQKEQIKKKLEVEDGVSNYAVNLIQKISG